MAKRFGKPAPFALIRWTLAERFGWTPAQVDALSVADIKELSAVDDGREKAKENERDSYEHFKQMGVR